MRIAFARLSRRCRLAAAVLWRQFWANEGRLRALFWGDRYGFDFRSRPGEALAVVAPLSTNPGMASRTLPRSSDLGVIARKDARGSNAVLAEAGRFYGLDVHETAPENAAQLVQQAIDGGWPLVGIEAAAGAPQRLNGLLRIYVAGGGTLLLSGIGTHSRRDLRLMADDLGITVSEGGESLVQAREVVFSRRERGFAHELAGVTIEASGPQATLGDVGRSEALAWLRTDDGLVPAVAEHRIGGGRVVMVAGAPRVERLAEAVSVEHPLLALPAMMLIRQAYGESAWRAPASFANFIIDDPALRNGRLGLDYRRALSQAQEHDFHVTVATIPHELELAEPDIIAMLHDQRRWLSACYHGSSHSGYEFYLPEARRMRYRARPLAAQQRSLVRAAEHAHRFYDRTGLALDRVMVFPHGIGSPQVFGMLQSLGFVSTCNFDDRYPLGAPVPNDFDIGMRPADLAWAGFPLMWRRGLPDRSFVVDLFLGRPVITFGHSKALGRDLQPFADRADELNGIGLEDLRWSGLEEISRHSYLQRRDPKHGWRVLMLSNEICLHNPDARPRSYVVERPLLPIGLALASDAGKAHGPNGLAVTVPPGGTSTVLVVGPGARSIAAARRCWVEDLAAERTSA